MWARRRWARISSSCYKTLVIQQNSSRFQSLRSSDVKTYFFHSAQWLPIAIWSAYVCVYMWKLSFVRLNKQKYKTIKLKRLREICITSRKERVFEWSNETNISFFFLWFCFKHVHAAKFSIRKNYLFGFVSALTVSCMLLRCAVQYELFQMHIFRQNSNNTL